MFWLFLLMWKFDPPKTTARRAGPVGKRPAASSIFGFSWWACAASDGWQIIIATLPARNRVATSAWVLSSADDSTLLSMLYIRS